jgi:hypothetical protein
MLGGFYLTILVIIFFVAVVGANATMRMFAYTDLELRYLIIRYKLWMMKRKIHQQLTKQSADCKQLIEELKDQNGKQ